MTTEFIFDPARSRFTVQAMAAGLLSAFAHSPTFAIASYKGSVQFDPATTAGGRMDLTVQADSLRLNDAVSDKDRAEIERTMQADVLESGRYPEISFSGTEIAFTRITPEWFRGLIRGTMRLHGRTRPHEIDAQFRMADGNVRVSGEFKLSQTAYGIRLTSAVGGMIKVKDEVKFVFDLLAVEKK